jgi:hypothetical protein
MSRTGCFIANLKHLFTACLPLKTNCKMLTINAEIKSDGKRLDGTYNVKLRFTLDRKMRRQGTSLFATPLDLTKDLRIKQSSPLKREVESNSICRGIYHHREKDKQTEKTPFESATAKTYTRVLRTDKAYWNQNTYLGKSERHNFHSSADKRNLERG